MTVNEKVHGWDVPFSHFNDPDTLEVENGGMNADENRLHISLRSMLTAPLAGNNLRSMTEEIRNRFHIVWTAMALPECIF